MKYETTETQSGVSSAHQREDEVVVVLHYPRDTELLQIHDDMDQIGRRLIALADGSYEGVRMGRP